MMVITQDGCTKCRANLSFDLTFMLGGSALSMPELYISFSRPLLPCFRAEFLSLYIQTFV
jgi:hypothetical protein